MSPKTMLMGMLLITYDATIGDELYTAITLSSLEETIFLRCQHGFKGRSRLELANACSSEASCLAMSIGDLSNITLCSCPAQISWPRYSEYDISMLRIRRLSEPLPVPDVSLPMDNATDHVVKGSMSGAMTSGAALVAAQVGNGLYTDGQTGHVNYGNHYTECCHIPDMCAQGVTFDLWIKREIGAGKGIVLHTGGYERNSKGYYVRFPAANWMIISTKWKTTYDYYFTSRGDWVSGQWLHLIFTWKAGEGIRAYLNGCDMDPGGKKSYAFSRPRSKSVTAWYPFKVGSGIDGFEDADGTIVDELHIWYETMSPLQIWQFYTQGGSVH